MIERIYHRFLIAAAVFVVAGVLDVSIAYSQDNELVRRSQRVGMEEVTVSSPNGRIAITILPNAERLMFTVTKNGRTVIEPSPLKMFVDGIDLSAGVGFRGIERYEVNKRYDWYGKHNTAENRCNGARIELEHDLSFTGYVLELRAYDTGVAFRHIVPGAEDASRVPGEYTKFVIPAGVKAWYHGLGGHYEAAYKDKMISDIDAGEWAGPPVTMKLAEDEGYISITEANLVDYAGMALEADGRRGWIIGLGHRQPLNYPFALRYGREEGRRLSQPAAVEGTIKTPWRVVFVTDTLNELVNSDIVHNLCPAPNEELFPDGIKTEWINPGKGVWRYLDGGERTLEGMKEFSRLAGEMGFEHHIIEGFWRRWSMDERKELVDYSREQDVSVWFWCHTRELRTPAAREEFFSMLAELGVDGAKLDFFDHEAKEVVDLYEALLECAARHKILVDFHGANKPTGRNRTWPNELVREAVRGMESSSMDARARHETILPFARYLAGPADYTSMHFGERRGDTTVTHQLATAAIFDSPLLILVTHPKTMLEHPAVEMIESIPAVWDETIVLNGSAIGELAAFARRKGDTWFLAVVCGPDRRALSVDLAFLDDGDYEALMVRDVEDDPEAVDVSRDTVENDGTIEIEMPPGGGFVARFTR